MVKPLGPATTAHSHSTLARWTHCYSACLLTMVAVCCFLKRLPFVVIDFEVLALKYVSAVSPGANTSPYELGLAWLDLEGTGMVGGGVVAGEKPGCETFHWQVREEHDTVQHHDNHNDDGDGDDDDDDCLFA